MKSLYFTFADVWLIADTCTPVYLCVFLQIFDSPEELKTKVETLAQWIRDSQYMVVHSGAGISTSTGIPDFR